MSNDNILKGQVALVTGANSGIGKAIALALGWAGAAVAVNYVSHQSKAEEVVTQIQDIGGSAMAVPADVSKEDDVQHMFEQVGATFGKLDILVNNAGLQDDAPIQEMTLAQWRKVIDVDLTGAFLCAREAARIFLQQADSVQPNRCTGKIIFISSVHEIIPWAGHANYAAAKGGVMLLMKSLAQELAPRRIRVNSIAPGAIKTDINRAAWESPVEEAKLRKLIPYNRVGETSDIAPIAVWLVSDESDYITGTTIYADGGMLLYPGFRTGG